MLWFLRINTFYGKFFSGHQRILMGIPYAVPETYEQFLKQTLNACLLCLHSILTENASFRLIENLHKTARLSRKEK